MRTCVCLYVCACVGVCVGDECTDGWLYVFECV